MPVSNDVAQHSQGSCLLPWQKKNLGQLWLAYTELQGDFCMVQFISVDSRHFTQSVRTWAFCSTLRQ